MSTDLHQASKNRSELFLQLMPMTIAIAGLPTSEHGKYLTEEHMELRARTLKLAFRQARALLKEVIQDQTSG
jgi:hypothetical protein